MNIKCLIFIIYAYDITLSTTIEIVMVITEDLTIHHVILVYNWLKLINCH